MRKSEYDRPEDYRNHTPDHEFDGSWNEVDFIRWLIKTRKREKKPLYFYLIE